MKESRDAFKAEQRKDRLIREHIHDTYRNRKKMTEPAVCSECGAVYQNSRWSWGVDKPSGAHEALCAACHRISDRCPAGILTLSGGFLLENREEVINLVRNEEKKEKGEHPLHRIMGIEEGDEKTVITTTDIHLPRRIGDALHSAYGGDLDFHYVEESYLLRINWKR